MTSAEIEAARTPIACQIEAVNHMITVWFMQHKGCCDEISQYRTAQSQLDTIAEDDDEAASYLQLTLALDWFRSLYGHDWNQ